jgi:hypothetical protein
MQDFHVKLAADTLCCEAGRTQDALAVARLIPEEYRAERTVGICFIAQVMAEKGDGRGARELLDEVKVDSHP